MRLWENFFFGTLVRLVHFEGWILLLVIPLCHSFFVSQMVFVLIIGFAVLLQMPSSKDHLEATWQQFKRMSMGTTSSLSAPIVWNSLFRYSQPRQTARGLA